MLVYNLPLLRVKFVRNKYNQTIDWLFQQFPSYQEIGAEAYKPGLERVEKLLSTFGNPHLKTKTIHVAGTNGKGSTCSFLASILTEKGEKVGLFTSPHIFDFKERIRINGTTISEEDVVSFCTKLQEIELPFQPSFFEITFVMAMEYFASQNCTYAIIETGLGGRLDATNVVLPLLSIITNIGLDHQQFLGHSIAEIAAEKAKLEKERQKIVTALKQMQESSGAKDDKYLEGVQEMQATLESIDSGLTGLTERAANTKAGHVYVISNVGAFGARVIKIGMTRRMDPEDRVKELSDA